MTPLETTPSAPPVFVFRRPLIIAGILTLLAGVALVVVGVAVVAQLHGTFSIGVGAMLLVYGLLVAAIGWVAIRGRTWATGPLIAAGVLHALVVVAVARNASPWWWTALVPLLVTVIAGVIARAREHRPV